MEQFPLHRSNVIFEDKQYPHFNQSHHNNAVINRKYHWIGQSTMPYFDIQAVRPTDGKSIIPSPCIDKDYPGSRARSFHFRSGGSGGSSSGGGGGGGNPLSDDDSESVSRETSPCSESPRPASLHGSDDNSSSHPQLQQAAPTPSQSTAEAAVSAGTAEATTSTTSTSTGTNSSSELFSMSPAANNSADCFMAASSVQPPVPVHLLPSEASSNIIAHHLHMRNKSKVNLIGLYLSRIVCIIIAAFGRPLIGHNR